MKLRAINIGVPIVIALHIALFLYTALDKFLLQDRFINAMATSPWLKPYRHILGPLIPILELAIVIMLILPSTKRAGLISAIALLSVFMIYIAAMLTVSSKLPCGCGGIINALSWKGHLVFNAIFTGLGLAALYGYKQLNEASIQSGWRPRISAQAGEAEHL